MSSRVTARTVHTDTPAGAASESQPDTLSWRHVPADRPPPAAQSTSETQPPPPEQGTTCRPVCPAQPRPKVITTTSSSERWTPRLRWSKGLACSSEATVRIQSHSPNLISLVSKAGTVLLRTLWFFPRSQLLPAPHLPAHPAMGPVWVQPARLSRPLLLPKLLLVPGIPRPRLRRQPRGNWQRPLLPSR